MNLDHDKFLIYILYKIIVYADNYDTSLIFKECYMIGHETSRFHVNMTQRRHRSASIVVGNRLWVLGGCCEDAGRTSEYVSINDGINSEVGPDLPISLQDHAVVSLNETTAMLIGGQNVVPWYGTYYYSHLTQQWTPGPNLVQNGVMQYYEAGIITDQITMEDHVVVLGYGYFFGDDLYITILENNQWKKGTEWG